MVLNKKPVERNRDVLNHKGKKISRQHNEFTEEILRVREEHLQSLDDRGDRGQEPVEPEKETGESVSMESMVCLHDSAAKVQFGKAIHFLRQSKFQEALKLFQDVTKYAQGLPGFGNYVIYKRSQNKRTTLSALYMFQALAYEGLSNPRKAIECCNFSISEDPGWPIPFSKRSDYFSCFEQYLLDTDGASTEEAQRCRNSATILVGANCAQDGKKCFADLQDALNCAKDGDEIFMEKGFYYREEGFNVTSGCTLTGASSRGCIIVSKGNPTLQIFGGDERNGKGIILTRLQFRNKADLPAEESRENTSMKSSASHIFIISPENITIRDCLFVGGEEETGGILVAEEAFYQSLLELEFQNPELLQGSEKVVEKCLRLLINNCTFSDCKHNSAISLNSQSTVIMSNSCVYNCSTGIKAQEGSTVNLLNCEIRGCEVNCIETDTISTVNIRGGLISESGNTNKKNTAGLFLKGSSKANIAKSLFRHHTCAVNSIDSDLIFESNCVMDIGDDVKCERLEDSGLEVQTGSLVVRGQGTSYIQRNNFHNCSLVFLIQSGAEPTISENNIETCLIGLICGSQSKPRICKNVFHCILMSIGIFIEESKGSVSENIFRYVANGLDVYKSSAPSIESNTFTSLSLPGLSGSLAYDIQKVKSGKVEDMENADIITFNALTDQAAANDSVRNRFSTVEKIRVCCNCRKQRPCTIKCGVCQQIFYCSEACQSTDRKRHSNFCSLSLKDML